MIVRALRHLGTLAMAGIYVVGGYNAARDPGQRPRLAGEIGVPEPELAVRLNGAAMMVGGAALAIGYHRRLTAAGLMTSMGLTTYAGHPFWKEDDAQARNRQLTQFLKNLGLIGGLLLVVLEPRPRRPQVAERVRDTARRVRPGT